LFYEIWVSFEITNLANGIFVNAWGKVVSIRVRAGDAKLVSQGKVSLIKLS